MPTTPTTQVDGAKVELIQHVEQRLHMSSQADVYWGESKPKLCNIAVCTRLRCTAVANRSLSVILFLLFLLLLLLLLLQNERDEHIHKNEEEV